jgi:tRNA(Ile2) C34 agmatinyltransferase TiaS
MKKEYHISECCKADLFFKGKGKGFWCSKCKKEITHTIVAFTDKEIKALKELRDKLNN